MTLPELEADYLAARAAVDALAGQPHTDSGMWAAHMIRAKAGRRYRDAGEWLSLPAELQAELLAMPDEVVAEIRRRIARSGKQWPKVPSKHLAPYRFAESPERVKAAEVVARQGTEWLRGLS